LSDFKYLQNGYKGVSKSSARKGMSVQFRPPAPHKIKGLSIILDSPFFFDWGDCDCKKNPKNQLHNGQKFLCVAMEKPIVPDQAKSSGQDMLQDEKQKIFSFEGAVSRFSGFTLDVLKCDLAILI
jgi:hypothetical protein